MKKLLLICVLFLTMIGIVIFSAYEAEQRSYIEFKKDGYILTTGTSVKDENAIAERYNFKSGSKYKPKYPERVTFPDTEGEKITTGMDNFIHYNDGSLSALTDGVLVNLEQASGTLVDYYSVSPKSLIEKKGALYSIDNAGNKINLTSFIYKISDTKYVIVSDKIILNLETESSIEVEGYIELNFVEKGIVQLANQKSTYQTVNQDATVEFGDGIILDFFDKSVVKKDEPLFNLAQMVIDSDDNIEIAPPRDKKEETKKNNDKDKNNNPSGEETRPGSTSDKDVEIVESQTAPKFRVLHLTSNAISADVIIEIEDKYDTLASDVITRIIDTSTGKTVMVEETPMGMFEIRFTTENLNTDTKFLTPNNEYALISTADYTENGEVYTKDFVTKIFRTDALGVALTKAQYTEDSLSFTVAFDEDSKVEFLNAVIMKNGVPYEEPVPNNDPGSYYEKTITFTGLTSNTEYRVFLANMEYQSSTWEDSVDISLRAKTLKKKPKIIGDLEFVVDQRDAAFTLMADNVEDDDKGIINYRYEIYDVNDLKYSVESDPVKVIIRSNAKSFDVKVDERELFRKTAYKYKLILEFDDNEKIVEIESGHFSGEMELTGRVHPTVTAQWTNVTFERLEGVIKIVDPENAVSLTKDDMVYVTFTNQAGYSKIIPYSATALDGKNILFDENGLKANEVHIISVFANVNLNDGSGERKNWFIGNIVVETGKPNDLSAKFDINTTQKANAFEIVTQIEYYRDRVKDGIGQLDLKSNSEQAQTVSSRPANNILEVSTLEYMTVSIYEGQFAVGNPKATVSVYDSNPDPYKSSIMDQYYTGFKTLSPAFFCTNSSGVEDQNCIKSYDAKFYTIVIEGAHDYATTTTNKVGPNDIPFRLDTNTVVVETVKAAPPIPQNPSDTFIITKVTNQNVRPELDSDTIIGYKVQPKSNNFENAKRIVYRVYDAVTHEFLEEKSAAVTNDYLPQEIFDLGDGTPYTMKDTTLRRGNEYYFTYDIYIETINGSYWWSSVRNNPQASGENDYCTKENQVSENCILLTSQTVKPNKQAPRFELYPSVSTLNSITLKYKYTDIDFALYQNKLFAWIGTTERSSQTLVAEGQDFMPMTLGSLISGTLAVKVDQALLKTVVPAKVDLFSQPFEGEIGMDDIGYDATLEYNRIVITLNGDAQKLNKIAGLKVRLTSRETAATREFDNLPITVNDNGFYTAQIALSDISNDFIGKELTLFASVYYDTGLVGFEFDNTPYYLLQKKNGIVAGKYLSLENTNNPVVNFIEDSTAINSLYDMSFNRTDKKINITSKVNGKSKLLDLNDYNKEGIRFNGYTFLAKKVGFYDVGEFVLSNKFNFILPTVNLHNSSTGRSSILSTMDDILALIQYNGTGASLVQNNQVFVELYEGRPGNGADPVRTLTFQTSDLANQIRIESLNAGEPYYLKIFVNIADVESSTGYSKQYLYDSYHEDIGHEYGFETKQDAGISITGVSYEANQTANSYSDKRFKVSYTLAYTSGYSAIKYKVYDANGKAVTRSDGEPIIPDTTNIVSSVINTYMYWPTDLVCKDNQEEDVPCAFGKQYKIEIIAFVDDFYGELYKELGSAETTFSTKVLDDPGIYFDSRVDDTNEMTFFVNISDFDRSVVKGLYNVRIEDDKGQIVKEFVDDEGDLIDYSIGYDSLNIPFVLSTGAQALSGTYKIVVIMKLDKTNIGAANIRKFEYSTETLNDEGIFLGEPLLVKNQSADRVDLHFYGTFGLEKISKLRYSYVNTSAGIFSSLQTVTFNPGFGPSGQRVFNLTDTLVQPGRYTYSLQFLDANNSIVASKTVYYQK